MEKRTLLAVVLSAGILLLYYTFWYQPPPPPKPVAQTAASPAPASGPAAVTPQAQAPTTTRMETPAVPQVEERPILVNNLGNNLVKGELTSKSGFLLNWWLLNFYQEADKKGPNTDLLQGDENNLPMGLLLYPGKGPIYPYYERSSESSDALEYVAQIENLQIQQLVSLGENPYTLEVKLNLKNLASVPQTLNPGIRLATLQKKMEKKGGFLNLSQPDFISPVYRLGTKVEREKKLKKLGEYQEATGDISWSGLEGRYFLRVVIAGMSSGQNKTAFGKKGGWIFSDFQYSAETLAAGEEKQYSFTLYLGPKDPTYLNNFRNVALGNAIDYGWFAVVARPILISLKFFDSFLKNWGLAIILLTVIIKVLTYPLTRKSMASMKSMQTLQPQLKKLREKFKDDKERLNQETMQLFKTHKVNPMGGCLPMIIQMPIYIALYKVLYNATELYHAPFFWFYRDLSAPDPYFVLPILLGISMFAQQKMTPTTGDPSQAKIMMFMPILFTVFMLFLPVGLVLYIFVNTITTVIQQYMHQHDLTFMGLFKGKKA